MLDRADRFCNNMDGADRSIRRVRYTVLVHCTTGLLQTYHLQPPAHLGRGRPSCYLPCSIRWCTRQSPPQLLQGGTGYGIQVENFSIDPVAICRSRCSATDSSGIPPRCSTWHALAPPASISIVPSSLWFLQRPHWQKQLRSRYRSLSAAASPLAMGYQAVDVIICGFQRQFTVDQQRLFELCSLQLLLLLVILLMHGYRCRRRHSC